MKFLTKISYITLNSLLMKTEHFFVEIDELSKLPFSLKNPHKIQRFEGYQKQKSYFFQKYRESALFKHPRQS